jgi:hypothetical protein
MPQQVQLMGQGLEQYCVVPIPLKGCTPFKGYTNIIYFATNYISTLNFIIKGKSSINEKAIISPSGSAY